MTKTSNACFSSSSFKILCLRLWHYLFGIIKIHLLKITLHSSFLRKSEIQLTNAKSFKHGLPSCTTLLLVLADPQHDWESSLCLRNVSLSALKTFSGSELLTSRQCGSVMFDSSKSLGRGWAGADQHSCAGRGGGIVVLGSGDHDPFKKRLNCKLRVVLHKQSLLYEILLWLTDLYSASPIYFTIN